MCSPQWRQRPHRASDRKLIQFEGWMLKKKERVLGNFRLMRAYMNIIIDRAKVKPSMKLFSNVQTVCRRHRCAEHSQKAVRYRQKMNFYRFLLVVYAVTVGEEILNVSDNVVKSIYFPLSSVLSIIELFSWFFNPLHSIIFFCRTLAVLWHLTNVRRCFFSTTRRRIEIIIINGEKSSWRNELSLY